MADLTPFRGLLYNRQRVPDLSEVVTPPFDVITEAEQEAAYRRHPRNMIRLILSKSDPGDPDPGHRHRRAGAAFRDWIRERVLVRDALPAIYLSATDFAIEDRRCTRFGFVARVRLVPFDQGVVIPHEKTFSKVKADRLDLMKAAHANFSPIFSMFVDEENRIMGTLRSATRGVAPDFDFVDILGNRQRLWALTDTGLHRFVAEEFRGRRLFIADGHHRYETCLNYSRWVRSADPGLPEEHPANFTMMYLTSMSDPGLIVLPAHRLLRSVEPARLATLVEDARQWFDVERFPLAGTTHRQVPGSFTDALGSTPPGTTLGLILRDRPECYLLRLKDGVMERRYGERIAAPLRAMDVTVLTRLVFMDLLNFDRERLDDDRLITYASRIPEAARAVFDGACAAAFLLNPTPIAQVRQIAENGLIMPRKATYFYPKVMVGLVINVLEPAPEKGKEQKARR